MKKIDWVVIIRSTFFRIKCSGSAIKIDGRNVFLPFCYTQATTTKRIHDLSKRICVATANTPCKERNKILAYHHLYITIGQPNKSFAHWEVEQFMCDLIEVIVFKRCDTCTYLYGHWIEFNNDMTKCRYFVHFNKKFKIWCLKSSKKVVIVKKLIFSSIGHKVGAITAV